MTVVTSKKSAVKIKTVDALGTSKTVEIYTATRSTKNTDGTYKIEILISILSYRILQTEILITCKSGLFHSDKNICKNVFKTRNKNDTSSFSNLMLQ